MFRSAATVLSSLLMTGLALGCAHAEEPSGSDAEAGEEAPPPESDPDAWKPPGSRPSIGLDSLLRPRGELRIEPRQEVLDVRGGRDRETWYRDYQDALQEVSELKETVDSTQERMRRASGGSVTYSPMGAAETHDPEVVKLRAQLKRDRQSLDTAKSRLREIEVEASLGEVPDHWLHEAPPPGS